jgi:hypothetical protein
VSHACDVALEPDQRWENFIGGVTSDGVVMPMSVEVLQELINEYAEIVQGIEGGPADLLDTARGLFVQSWFRYELMVQACLVSLQAVEAAVRQHYPDKEKLPFRRLVDRAETEGVITPDGAEHLRAGVHLRNKLSHPKEQLTLTIGMAGPILRTSHLLVRELAA